MRALSGPLAFTCGVEAPYSGRVHLLGTDGTLVYIRRDAQIFGVTGEGTVVFTERAPERFERLAWESGVLLALSGDGAGGRSWVATRFPEGGEVWTHPRAQLLLIGQEVTRLPELDTPPCDVVGDLLLAAGYNGVLLRECASGRDRWRSEAVRGTYAAFLGGHVVVADPEASVLHLLDGTTGDVLEERRVAGSVISLLRVRDGVLARSFGGAELLTLHAKGEAVSLASRALFDRWPARQLVIRDGERAVFSNGAEHAVLSADGTLTWVALREGDQPVSPDFASHGLVGGTTAIGTCWVLPVDSAPDRAVELVPRPVVTKSEGPVGDWVRGTVLFAGAKTMSVRLETGKNATLATLAGAEKGREVFVGEFDRLGTARAARFEAPTADTSAAGPSTVGPAITITPIAPAKTTVPAGVMKAVRTLNEAALLEPMAEDRLWLCANIEWGELSSSKPEDVLIAAHAMGACTAEPGAACPHRALALEVELQSDMNLDGNAFGKLQALLDASSIPVKVTAVNDDGVTAKVSCRGFEESVNLEDAEDSTTALTELLNRALKKAKVAERFHRIHSKDSSYVVLLLRSSEAAAELAKVLGTGPVKRRASRGR